MLIEKDSKINDIIQNFPHTRELFRDLNMSCSSCFAVHFDTLENGALMHGMDVISLIYKIRKYIHSRPTSITLVHKS